MDIEEKSVFSSVQSLKDFMNKYGGICNERWIPRKLDGKLYREVSFEQKPYVEAIVIHQLDDQTIEDLTNNAEHLKIGHFITGGYALYRTWINPSLWEEINL